MLVIANIIAIFRKELQGYFASPLAYIIAAVFWLLSGYFFVKILYLDEDSIIQQVAFQEQLGYATPPTDVPYVFISSFFGVMGSLILFILPILSMGLYADERKQRTLELLATSPLYNWVVALGKLLGVLTFFMAMTLPIFLYEAVAFSAAQPEVSIAVPLLAHLGLILLAAAVLSLGMFVSSLTDSTILAAILSFALVLFLWLVDIVGNSIGGEIGKAIEQLSLIKHYNNLTQGIFESSSLVLFGSYILVGIFLTAQSIETFRFSRQ
jgi:ABC-2 type transport system permease protein